MTLFSIVLTAKCKNNSILDKTNKKSTIKYILCRLHLYLLSLSFSSGNLNVRFCKLYIFNGNGRVRKKIIPSRQRVNRVYSGVRKITSQERNLSGPVVVQQPNTCSLFMLHFEKPKSEKKPFLCCILERLL